MIRAAFVFCAAGILVTSHTAWSQTATRDAAKPAPTGTGMIAGTVVNDDSASQPVRRARVWIATSDRQVTRTAVTDDAGRFELAGLPAGRYSLSANKQGYVTLSYGAKRPNRPGIALVLGEGQRLTGLMLRMVRGSIITGVIVDHNGDPQSGANVNAMRYAFTGSGRTLAPAGSADTDDRGQYRIWGLPAGEYVVSATVGVPARTDVEITRVTDADVKRALNEVASAVRPGPAGAPGGSSFDGRGGAVRTVGYAPVFYPGTFVSTQAAPIKLGVAEERTGIDFSLSLVPTAKVEGTVIVPDGVKAPTLIVQMVGNNPPGLLLDVFRRSTPTADGHFAFAGVPPGEYTIAVRGSQPARAPGPPGAPTPPPGPGYWATTGVTVDGQDISGISMTLQPGLTVSGRIQFEGTSTAPDPARFRVSLAAVQAPGEVSVGTSAATPDATGAFTIAGVTPGRYRLTASISSPRPETTWQLKSSILAGRETLDTPLELREGTDGAVITFTDRVTELAGVVQDSAGQPAPENHVVVFSADRSHWSPQSRRIRSVRPAADGRYVFPNLPPGDYLLTAVTDIENGEWFDPAVLEQLARASIKVSIGEGEKKPQDLRLAAQ